MVEEKNCLLWRFVSKKKVGIARSRLQWIKSDVTAKIQKKKHAYIKSICSQEITRITCYTLVLGTRLRVLVVVGPRLGTWKRKLLRMQRKIQDGIFCLHQDKN